MKIGKQKNAITRGMALLLGCAIPCTAAWAQTQTELSSQGQSQQTTMPAQNPYVQAAPQMTGGQMVMPSLGGNSSGAQDGGNGPAGNVFYPDIKTYVLSAGDVINVRLYGAPDYMTTLRLSKDGTADLPLIGDLALSGMTIDKAQATIEDKLKSAGMYRAPHISIVLVEYDEAQATVMFAGDLHGKLSTRRARTVTEAINSAGGLPPGSNPVVSIIRPGVTDPIQVNVGLTGKDMSKADVPLQAGDTIFIQRAGTIYLVGAFKTPGLFAMQPGRTTLLQVSAMSGGPLYSAKYEDMRIIRTVGNERTEVKVDVQKVLYGRAPDPILEPGDIVFLPTSAIKAAISSGGLATLVNLLNVALVVATR